MMDLINGSQTIQTTPTSVANPSVTSVEETAKALKPVLQMIQGSKDPGKAMQQLCMASPEFKRAYEQAQAIASGNPKDVFYAQAKAQGIDPDAIISALRG